MSFAVSSAKPLYYLHFAAKTTAVEKVEKRFSQLYLVEPFFEFFKRAENGFSIRINQVCRQEKLKESVQICGSNADKTRNKQARCQKDENYRE